MDAFVNAPLLQEHLWLVWPLLVTVGLLRLLWPIFAFGKELVAQLRHQYRLNVPIYGHEAVVGHLTYSVLGKLARAFSYIADLNRPLLNWVDGGYHFDRVEWFGCAHWTFMAHPFLAWFCHLFTNERYALQLVVDRQPHPSPYVVETVPVEGKLQHYRCKQVTWNEYIDAHREEIEEYVWREGATKFHHAQGFATGDVDWRRFRSYNGFGNNREDPYCGMANMPYGQVLPFRDWSKVRVPDVMEVQRRLNARPHHWPEMQCAPNDTNGFTSMFAFLIIHDFFSSNMPAVTSGLGKYQSSLERGMERDNDCPHNTDKHYWTKEGRRHGTMNTGSSFLDLTTLYGNSERRAREIRRQSPSYMLKDGLEGIGEERGFLNHSSVRAILTLYRDEHNYIAQELKQQHPKWSDDLIFETARAINIGVYTSSISRDYGCGVIGICPKDGSGGFPDLRLVDWSKGVGKSPCPVYDDKNQRRQGFHASLEFDLVYTFHSTAPIYKSQFLNRHPDQCREHALLEILRQPSGRFGPNNTEDFEPIHWGNAKTLTRSRYMGMGSWTDFLEIMSNNYVSTKKEQFIKRYNYKQHPEVAATLSNREKETYDLLNEWYGPDNAENVEIIVGFLAEQSNSHGWGAGTDMAAAIVADAFASIRYDRFLTENFNPEYLTEWGYNHALKTTLVDLMDRHTAIRHLGKGYPTVRVMPSEIYRVEAERLLNLPLQSKAPPRTDFSKKPETLTSLGPVYQGARGHDPAEEPPAEFDFKRAPGMHF